MGVGPFDFNRPFTAGDDGVLGFNRPLVGAANGVSFQVDPESASNVVLQETVPQPILNTREELEVVQEELKNKRERIAELEDIPFYERFQELKDPMTGREEVVNMRKSLMEDEYRLEGRRDELQNELRQMEASPENNIDMIEVTNELQNILRRELTGLGISKGPVTRFTGDRIEVTLTMVGMDQSDIEAVSDEMEDLGLQIINREFFQT